MHVRMSEFICAFWSKPVKSGIFVWIKECMHVGGGKRLWISLFELLGYDQMSDVWLGGVCSQPCNWKFCLNRGLMMSRREVE